MGAFNHGNIKWDSLQSTGVEDQRFVCLVQDTFLNSACIRTTQSSEGIIHSAVLTERIRRQCSNTRTIGQQRSTVYYVAPCWLHVKQHSRIIIISPVYTRSWTVMFDNVCHELMRNTPKHAHLVYYCLLAVFGTL